MASAYLGPESPRPLAVISERYRGNYHLPNLNGDDRLSLGPEYEKEFFSLLHKYLELDTTDTLCYIGDTRDGLVSRMEKRFCLMEPVRTLVPGHFHYAETGEHKMVPIRISHVGAEEYFRRLAREKELGAGKGETFQKVLLHDACRYLTHPAELYKNIACSLAPGGTLLIVHRPAHLSTLPFFRDAQHRLADNDVPYMDIVKDLQNVKLDVQWELEGIPVTIAKKKWLAMVRDRYPPQMEIMSNTEVLSGLRELTEGVLKYEGSQVEFTDRLLFIKATLSKFENGYPSIQRYSAGQFEPFPAQRNLKLTMKLNADFPRLPGNQRMQSQSTNQFKFLWG